LGNLCACNYQRERANVCCRRSKLSDAEKARKGEKLEEAAKEVSSMIGECKRLAQEWEREAKIDGMADSEVKGKKDEFKQRIKALEGRKKQLDSSIKNRKELLASSGSDAASGSGRAKAENEASSSGQKQLQQMETQEVAEQGRKEMRQTESSIERSKKVVNDTIEIGQKTATTLREQTEQMQRIEEGIDQVRFDLHRARGMVRDISKSIATDKCIMCLFALVIMAVVAIIVLEETKGSSSIDVPGRSLRRDSSSASTISASPLLAESASASASAAARQQHASRKLLGRG
jgi:SNARE protein